MNLRYFSRSLSPDFLALYTSRSISFIAIGFFGIFLPIFIYQVAGNNLVPVVLFYLFTSLFYVLLLPLAMRLINRIGMKRSLIFGTLMGAGYLGTLGLTNEENWQVYLSLTAVGLIIFRLFYWIPFHTDFAVFTDKGHRGREISLVESTRRLFGIFTPVIAGAIIARFGFEVLFLLAVVLYMAAVIPLTRIRRVNERYVWSYRQTWREFFSPKRRAMIWAFVANGAETGIGFVVWPIFLYLLLEGNYFEIGALSTLIVAATIALQLWAGKYVDSIDRTKLLRIGSSLYALGWIIKIFIITSFQIFLVDAYHRVMRIFMMTPFDALTYDIAADEGHYVDEFTVLKEMAVHLGRVIIFAVVLVLFVVFAMKIQWIFIVAALASLAINALRVEKNL